jgi:phenylpropionate dioxygenase-like ring-hydroxylating dioxygenase large terminal subunit
MRKEDQIRLAECVLALVEAKTTDMAPTPYLRDVATYRDSARFELEKEIIFRRMPLWAGFSDDLSSPGDFLTHHGTGVPIVVLRMEDGTLAAYLNACRHRGARLVTKESGNLRVMSCPFHGWSYDHAGKLVGVPHRECFEGTELPDRGLLPMPVAEKFGMIFVCGTAGMTIDLDAHLGAIGPELGEWGLGRLYPAHRRVLNAAMNWKLALETYNENYHFSTLHRNTLAPVSQANVAAYQRFGRHHRLCFPTVDIRQLRGSDKAGWEPLDFMSFMYYLFPNFCLIVGKKGSRGLVVRAFSITPGATVGSSSTVDCAYTERPLATDAERAAFLRHFEESHAVIRDEDYPVGITVQDTVSSGLPMTFLFGRNELSLIDMHKEYDRVVGAAAHA